MRCTLSALACHLGRFHSSPGPAGNTSDKVWSERPRAYTAPQQGRHLFRRPIVGLSRHLASAQDERVDGAAAHRQVAVTVNTRSAASDYNNNKWPIASRSRAPDGRAMHTCNFWKIFYFAFFVWPAGLMCFSDFPFRLLLLLLSVRRLLKRFLYPLRTHIFVCVAGRVCVFYFPIQVAAGDVKMADSFQSRSSQKERK